MIADPLDLSIIAAYLLCVALLGVWIHRRATRGLASFYLGDRRMPWWLLGMAGCSSYIDIGGTMAMVGLMYWTGLQSVWLTHIFWGWLIICFYMAFQAKWIRRSGVMTFAEWNRTRFGDGKDAEVARIATALFLLVLMVFNLMFIAVGIGKFAEEFLPLARWQSTLLVFLCVGVYTTLGGFFGVILTDVLQTVLIALGAVLLCKMAFDAGDPTPLLAAKDPAWSSLAPQWSLWAGYAAEVPKAFQQYAAVGPLLLAGFGWLLFRVLAGPNVWDFQFFLTARSPRDAALAGGLWTVGYTLRWIIGAAFLVLGLHLLAARAAAEGASFDAEKVMPLVVADLPVGLRGLFVALLLAALMSTLDAMVNVTSSVVVNDLCKRYFAKNLAERAYVRIGQAASALALGLAFAISFFFDTVVGAWQTMIFVVVTMILVPATMRWHWWRFSARAFSLGMCITAALITAVKAWTSWPDQVTLPVTVGGSLLACLCLGFATRPTDREILVAFYANIRPFGFWGPIRREAARRGLVPARDPMSALDALNGILTVGLQLGLCLVPFLALLWRGTEALTALAGVAMLGTVLYFTWYRRLA